MTANDIVARDLNGDGKIDLVVAEFGYDHGRVLWLENIGNGGSALGFAEELADLDIPSDDGDSSDE